MKRSLNVISAVVAVVVTFAVLLLTPSANQQLHGLLLPAQQPAPAILPDQVRITDRCAEPVFAGQINLETRFVMIDAAATKQRLLSRVKALAAQVGASCVATQVSAVAKVVPGRRIMIYRGYAYREKG